MKTKAVIHQIYIKCNRRNKWKMKHVSQPNYKIYSTSTEYTYSTTKKWSIQIPFISRSFTFSTTLGSVSIIDVTKNERTNSSNKYWLFILGLMFWVFNFCMLVVHCEQELFYGMLMHNKQSNNEFVGKKPYKIPNEISQYIICLIEHTRHRTSMKTAML